MRKEKKMQMLLETSTISKIFSNFTNPRLPLLLYLMMLDFFLDDVRFESKLPGVSVMTQYVTLSKLTKIGDLTV